MKFQLKKFVSYYKPYRGLFTVLMLCALISTGVSLLIPLCTRYITKNVLEGIQSTEVSVLTPIYAAGGLMLILLLIQIICTQFVDYRGHAMGAMMERDMRAELFGHLQKLSFGFFDEQRVGQLMSRITNDLLCLTELYHHGPENIMIYFVRFVGAFVILMTINVKLTLVVFCFLPPMLWLALVLNKKMKKAALTSRERIGDVNSQVEDSLTGIRVVQSFANEKAEQEKFNQSNNRFMESRKEIYHTEAYLSQGLMAFTQLITIALIVFGGTLIVGASLDLADLITFLMYVAYLTEPVRNLLFMMTQFQEGVASFERFQEIMDLKPEIQDLPDAVELGRSRGMVTFRDVSFRYDKQQYNVLSHVSLTVEPGTYAALIGASGVGKTTLCSLIPRFYDVCGGEVQVDGIDIRKIKLESLRRNIGVVQQEVYLFAGTILENIGYGKPGATREEIVEAAVKANAHDFIMGLPHQYDTDIGQRGVKLSGGQRQRISIARVFLKNPPILILDEATSALDTESERVVWKSFEALAENRTAFVIAHRLSTIRNADRIYRLTDSGLMEETPAEIAMAE